MQQPFLPPSEFPRAVPLLSEQVVQLQFEDMKSVYRRKSFHCKRAFRYRLSLSERSVFKINFFLLLRENIFERLRNKMKK